jgi:hypothetical protein
MISMRQKKLIYRCVLTLLTVTMAGGWLARYLLHLDTAVIIWGISVGVVIGGIFFCMLPLIAFSEREPKNHWHHAAARAGVILCELAGALFIGFGVALIVGQVSDQLSVVVEPVGTIVFIVATILVFVGLPVILGLLAIGYIAQGNEETQQWPGTLGQRRLAAPTNSTEEEQPTTRQPETN